ncbi:GNAT family N-acetyltransferase [Streptomyces sp. TRM70308]|uniref:GNAT family N-acetyltransferase n=1 Tax=Streptomyces sp. TRM70308 TaxID=3131932 RepID=UPI003D052ABE
MSAAPPTGADAPPGACALRPVDPFADAALVHGWVTHPAAAHWLRENVTLPDVERELLRIAADPRHEAYIGLHRGEPAFLVERYASARPGRPELCPARPGDAGLHVLVAPAAPRLRGGALTALADALERLRATAPLPRPGRPPSPLGTVTSPGGRAGHSFRSVGQPLAA